MKKLILGFAAITISLGSFAQTDSSRNQTGRDRSTNQRQNNQQQNNTQNQNQTQDNNIHYQHTKECMLIMEGGEVKQVKEGKAMAMGKRITLDNGAEVTADGLITMKDGRIVRMKEGECVDKSGKVNPVKDAKKKDSQNIQ